MNRTGVTDSQIIGIFVSTVGEDQTDYMLRVGRAVLALQADHIVDANKMVPAIDVERMLRETVPGGTSCDPQAICDDIRAWFARNTTAEPCVPKFGARDTRCSLGTAGCVVVHEGAKS
jgi:hypothetical protein